MLGNKGWEPLPDAIDDLRSQTMPPPSEGAERVGWYVYGIVEAPGPVLPEGVLGVDGRHPPLAIVEGDLAAVVSEVPLARFGDETLREVLDDDSWLENTASAHERVLEALWAQTTVVPLPALTVYPAESEVCELLAGGRPLTT